MRVTRPVINNPARRVIAAFFARIQNNSTWRIVKFCFDFLYDLHCCLSFTINSGSISAIFAYRKGATRCNGRVHISLSQYDTGLLMAPLLYRI